MRDVISGFDRDAGNRQKCQKHGVTVAEIEAILSNNPTIAPDIKHAGSEDRFIAVGRNNIGRPIFIAFTFRIRLGQQLYRPVSARYMHTKEAAQYEKKSSQTKN
jgi:uncharacterized DUF497 family protein